MGDQTRVTATRRAMGLKLPLALAGAALFGSSGLASAQGGVAALPPPSTTDMARALEYMRRLLSEGAPDLRPGDRVVLTTDGSFDPAVIELVRQAVWERQGRLDVIQLQGVGEETDPAKLQIDLWCVDPQKIWPAWVWEALEGSAVVLSAYGPDVHNMSPAEKQWFADRNIKRLRFWHATFGTVLVDALEQGIGYPAEILAAASEVTSKSLAGARRVRITDPNGTDFSFSTARAGMVYPDARGQVVVYALHGGLVPRTTLHLNAGKVVKVEGEGDLADQMRWILANLDKYHFPTAPAPGGAVLVEADLDRIHPKIARPPWQGLHGAAKYFAFSKAYKRAGVLTIGFGTPTAVGAPAVIEFARARGLTIQHLDAHLYHATVTVDGRTLIRDGRPLALDANGVRKVAAKYGDPDELLRIDWVPALNGV